MKSDSSAGMSSAAAATAPYFGTSSQLLTVVKTTPITNARVRKRCWLTAISAYCVTELMNPIGIDQIMIASAMAESGR